MKQIENHKPNENKALQAEQDCKFHQENKQDKGKESRAKSRGNWSK